MSDERPPTEPDGGRASAFPNTRWSLIVNLRDENEQSAGDALAELCSIYWYPVYAFIRRSQRSAEDAEDLTQEFFSNVIRRGDFAKVEQQGNVRFRSFILRSVKNLLTSEFRKQTAKKRGDGAATISIDAELAEKRYQNEPADKLTPEDFFERRWAMTVIDAALRDLQSDYEDTDRGRIFETLKPLIPLKNDTGQYEEAAQELGMTPSAVSVAMHRMRKRYQACIREQISHTVADPSEVEDEIRYIFSLFSS